MTEKEKVASLVYAAWMGMTAVIESFPDTYTNEDVVNATLNVARQGIVYACADDESLTVEMVERNRGAVRHLLQRFMLDTVGVDRLATDLIPKETVN